MELDCLTKAEDSLTHYCYETIASSFIGLALYKNKDAITCVNFLTKTDLLRSEREVMHEKIHIYSPEKMAL